MHESRAPSSSGQDAGSSDRQHRFESCWGRKTSTQRLIAIARRELTEAATPGRSCHCTTSAGRSRRRRSKRRRRRCTCRRKGYWNIREVLGGDDIEVLIVIAGAIGKVDGRPVVGSAPEDVDACAAAVANEDVVQRTGRLRVGADAFRTLPELAEDAARRMALILRAGSGQGLHNIVPSNALRALRMACQRISRAFFAWGMSPARVFGHSRMRSRAETVRKRATTKEEAAMVSLARVVPADWTATARPTAPHTFGGRRLIASLSDDRVVIFSLDRRGRYTVGRDATADCNLHDLTVSRFHAAVTVEESITVEEVSSLNGVFVNDRRLGAGEKVVLAPGQVVRLGEVSITLVDVGVVSPSGREQAPLENGERAAPEQSGVIRVIRDPQMVKLHALARSVAAGNISVLLTGETGSGKEVFAEAIHRHSPRASKPFLSLNCAALSETLLESELFGYERGAFTGATQAKAGLLESADKGTIFLDEIGEMPAALQAKLLRVLEQRQVTRVGGLKAKAIDVRFISATNRDPEVEMERGAFRRDLFYRINGTMLFGDRAAGARFCRPRFLPNGPEASSGDCPRGGAAAVRTYVARQHPRAPKRDGSSRALVPRRNDYRSRSRDCAEGTGGADAADSRLATEQRGRAISRRSGGR